jgi:hypothetical protein
MTRAVQQAATITRITTRKNILTSYLLQSVWPRCWALLIYSGGINTNLHVTWQLTIKYQCCACECYRLLIIAILSQSRTFHVSCDLSDWSSHLLSISYLSAHCVGLITVKYGFSVASLEGWGRGWNVGLSALLWNLAQLWRWGCQLHVPAVLYPYVNSLGVISVRGWMDPRELNADRSRSL